MTTTGMRWLVAAAIGLIVCGGPAAVAGPAPATTTITIPDMDCAGCAKKIATKLVEVNGVAKAEYDVKAKTIKLTPKTNVRLSPKDLWEAVEKSEKVPSKLQGPDGVVFTTKPKE